MTSEIVIDRDVLDTLTAAGDIKPAMYTMRPDGRVNLRVGRKLRDTLDSLVVSTGLNYSGVLRALEELHAEVGGGEP